MPASADDHYRSLAPADRDVVQRMRKAIQKGGFEALSVKNARSTRERFRRTSRTEGYPGEHRTPLQQQLALELLSRRVPPHQWARLAADASGEPLGPQVTGIENMVKQMKEQRTPAKNGTPPPGSAPAERSTARVFGLTPEQIAAAGQEAVRERIADGRITPQRPAAVKTAGRSESLGLGG